MIAATTAFAFAGSPGDAFHAAYAACTAAYRSTERMTLGKPRFESAVRLLWIVLMTEAGERVAVLPRELLTVDEEDRVEAGRQRAGSTGPCVGPD